MSTFKGFVAEFPNIRIDYFRKNPDAPPPLACFLSHVHSDHLQGLESLKAPFVYCSPATRELLLRIEKYPHRMNFAKGILETRKQHYRHLKNLLKTIPLETPTEIELGPQAQLRVTLFDTNHCAGAVMFLIEGDGKAVLYTGDIRSEAWWVNSIVRNPLLIRYTLGDRRLDKIYLDTTFAVKSDPYRIFPSKAEGLKELLAQVAKYPTDTTFHFNSWTFGYEQVWIALSAALGSQVHIDKYKLGLYRSLATISADGVGSSEGPALCGYKCGNRRQAGCLTSDQSARLHSCERGTECSGISSKNVVWITPIITRTNTGAVIPELGAGGGGGDLEQVHELELNDTAAVGRLITLCSARIQDPHLLAKVINVVSTAMTSETKTLSFDGKLTTQDAEGNISLLGLTEILSMVAKDPKVVQPLSNPPSTRLNNTQKTTGSAPERLPRQIRFPYSRHSSYDELCHLVEAFKPRDVYPCTTDVESWCEEISVQSLFGHLCSGSDFVHDQEMRKIEGERVASRKLKRKRDEPSQEYCTQESSQVAGGSDSDVDTHLFEGVALSARPEKSRGETKRLRRQETIQDCIEGPKPAGRSLQSSTTPITATQKAFELSPDNEDEAESRLKTTWETTNLHKYRCAWLGCQEVFGMIGMLRRHVSDKHLTKGARDGHVAYGCLWGSCAGPNLSYFASEDTWEAHMDELHYHPEMKRVLDHGKGTKEQDSTVESPKSLPSPPVEDEDAHHPPLTLGPEYPNKDTTPTLTQPSDETNDNEKANETASVRSLSSFLPLPSSAFHTPTPTPTSPSFPSSPSPPTRTRTPTSPSRLRHRQEAYEAARDLSGREWAVYSPISAGNNHSVLEMEL